MNNRDSIAQPVNWQALKFFAFAYIWSWAWWVPVVLKLQSQGIHLGIVPSWIVPFVLIGAYGPSIAAIVFAAFSGGRMEVKRLLSKLLIWRAPAKVHLMVWLGHPAFMAFTIFIYANLFGPVGDLDWSGLLLIPTVLLTGVIFGPLAEELGWRGYVLPLLQKNYSPLVSSLIVGVAWCFWHTPLFWAPAGTLISGQEVTIVAVGKYLLFTCGLAIIFTWIVNHSKGSVLLSIAFHLIINASIPLLLFPNMSSNTSLEIKWFSLLPVWVVAIGISAFGRNVKSGN